MISSWWNIRRVFRKPEVMIKVKCDIHPSEAVWLGVVDHPFFAVTDEKGKFEIKGLPSGTYTFEVWHEKYKRVQIKVVVPKGKSKTVDLALKDRK